MSVLIGVYRGIGCRGAIVALCTGEVGFDRCMDRLPINVIDICGFPAGLLLDRYRLSSRTQWVL